MQTWANGAGRGAPLVAAVPALRHGTPADPADPAPPAEQLGAVRIARRVLRTVVEQAALSVPGVVRIGRIRGGLAALLGRPVAPQQGIALAVHRDTVAADLYLIVAPGVSMVDVGAAVQEAVGAAVEHILGMAVSEINVYIQDVA
jgi:uncharacterized alkaline shock family protein YloU